MLREKKVALVTGGTSGIGLAAVNALHEAGVTVYETSRRDAALQNAVHLPGDVTDEAAMARVAGEVLAREGQIDILVCCAGFGISGAVEYTELSAAKKQLDVNFFGVVNAVKAVLPHMRERGAGRVVVVSSVAGAIAIPFQTYYSASKAALNAYVAALRNELRPYGVTVTAVMPGDIATGFTDAREKSPLGDDTYGGRIGKSVARMEHDERTGMDPRVAGAYIRKMALRKSVPPSSSIGVSYKALVMLTRLLPARLTNLVVYWLYAK